MRYTSVVEMFKVGIDRWKITGAGSDL